MNAIKLFLIDRQSLYKGYPAPTLHSYWLVVDALSSYIPLREGAWQTDHNNSLFSTLPNYMASKSRAKESMHS